jgi:NADPH:quinone reductase-like Zn-dependent oxidoreductase
LFLARHSSDQVFCSTILGKVKHRVDSVFAFEDLLKAYEKVISGRCVGKVVIEVPAAQPPTSTDAA